MKVKCQSEECTTEQEMEEGTLIDAEQQIGFSELHIRKRI